MLIETNALLLIEPY